MCNRMTQFVNFSHLTEVAFLAFWIIMIILCMDVHRQFVSFFYTL